MGKITRKISLLIALCMIVTVGGVYAQWTYADSQDIVNEANGTIIVDMQSAVNQSASKGSFEVLLNTVKIEIQDNYSVDSSSSSSYVGTDAGDFIPELHITGQIVILYTFYNEENASSDAIGMTHTLSTTADMIYNGNNVFNIDHNDSTIYSVSKVVDDEGTDQIDKPYGFTTLNKTWNLGAGTTNDGRALTNSDIGKYIFVVNAESLKHHLSLNSAIKLSTLNEYHEFAAIIENANLLFTIKDSTITTTSET